VRTSPDTAVKATLFEDSAAIIGLVLAALGLVLRQLTGSPFWDGAASIAIGGLLVVIAIRLGLESKDFLMARRAALSCLTGGVALGGGGCAGRGRFP
jgi:hypothetical protein